MTVTGERRSSCRRISSTVLVALFTVFILCKESSSSESAERLFITLMDDYNNLIRPVDDVVDILNVTFGLSISQLIDIDEKNQVMTTSVWVKQRWKDLALVWNPDDFDGLGVIHIPVNMLWIPDIVLYNNADGYFDVQFMTNAIVYSDGTIYWVPPAIYKSSCKIDIEHFPFDEQRCIMKFGTWTYNGNTVDLIMMSENVEQEDYWENGEWEIVESPGERHALIYPCCPGEVYVDITYTFVLHRKPLFYIVTLVIPCLLISFLTMLVFYLPSDACEKITLSISILLALIVFLLLITEIIPPTSTALPLIGRYMLFTMSLVTISIVATVIVINIHFRNSRTHDMPRWVRKTFIDFLPKYLCMQRPDQDEDEEEHEVVTTSNDSYSAASALGGQMGPRDAGFMSSTNGRGYNNSFVRQTAQYMMNSLSPKMMEDMEAHHRDHDNNRTSSFMGARATKACTKETKEVLDSINYITNHLKSEDKEDQVSEDWKYVALVIDRLLLWIFMVICFVGTGGILFSSPVMWEGPNAHNTPTFEPPIVIEKVDYSIEM